MKTVFLVIRGEEYDGDSVIGVFKKEKKAKKFALKQKCCFYHKTCHHNPWRGGPRTWWTGGQYVTISEEKVR